jgi:hypothetical protein
VVVVEQEDLQVQVPHQHHMLVTLVVLVEVHQKVVMLVPEHLHKVIMEVLPQSQRVKQVREVVVLVELVVQFLDRHQQTFLVVMVDWQFLVL